MGETGNYMGWIATALFTIIGTVVGWFKMSHDKDHEQLNTQLAGKVDCNVYDAQHGALCKDIKEMKEGQEKFMDETRDTLGHGQSVMVRLETLVEIIEKKHDN